MAKPKKKSERPRTSDAGSQPLVTRYWHESARPLVSLVFVAPMIVAYEAGLVALGTQAMRNGADVWLRQLLEWIGFSQYFLLPVLTCSLLLGWHHLNQERWTIRWTFLYGMLFESMALGVLLLAAAHAQQDLLAVSRSRVLPPLALPGANALGPFIAFLGAGIYEELLFRVMLFPALAALLRLAGVPRRTSWVAAILASSLAFEASVDTQTFFGAY